MMAQGATVERLRVRTADTTRTTPRRVAALVRASHIRPAALPAGAILVVGSLQVTVSGVVPGPASVGELQRVLGGGVDAALKTASRPRGCVVDPSAAAVLFDDEAHLLACALRLRLRGRPRAWWSARLRRIDGSVASLLGHDVRLLPAVVDRLDGAGDAGRLVAALPDAVARDLTTGVLAAFGLPAVPPSSAPDTAAASPPGSPADSPRSRLLALGLRIIRTPASLRREVQAAAGESPGPAEAAPPRWQDGDGGDAVVSAGPDSVRGVDHRARRPPFLAQEGTPATRPGPPVPEPDAGAAGPTDAAAGRASRLQARSDRPGDGEAPTAAPRARSPLPRRVASRDASPVRSRHAASSRPRDTAPAGSPAPPPAVLPPAEAALGGVATGLAGVIYLIPLLQRLGWPDDADPAWRLDRLGGWTLLEMVARRLLAEEGAAVARDPLWGVLASLDGRRPDEVPPDGTVPEAAVRALGDRLAGALDMSPAQAVAVLRTPGRVTFTTTHVDVVMALGDISLPVRLAGLDRTPGWVPRLGRVVTVTFREHV